MISYFVTFRVRLSRGEMYIGHGRDGRLCVCLSVPRCILILLRGLGCNLGEMYRGIDYLLVNKGLSLGTHLIRNVTALLQTRIATFVKRCRLIRSQGRRWARRGFTGIESSSHTSDLQDFDKSDRKEFRVSGYPHQGCLYP